MANKLTGNAFWLFLHRNHKRMKQNKTLIYTFLALIVVGALYRLVPNRPENFAPMWAMGLFAGSLIKERKYAFAVPLLSMFISDILYHLLYINGIGITPGFYGGQWINYLLFAGLTVVGFYINAAKASHIIAGSFASPTLYFIVSNFLVWLKGGGWGHPKTWEGLLLTYADGVPFYQNSIYATLVFSAVLFGGYALVRQSRVKTA